MKSDRDPLDRLFRAAARAPRAAWEEPAFGLETRTLAAWRRGRVEVDGSTVVRLLRYGLGVASAVMVAIIALSLRNMAEQPEPALAVPNVAVTLALSQ